MTVKEFLNKYNSLSVSTAKENLIKSIIVKDKRLQFVEKKGHAERIARLSCTDAATGAYKVDSIMTAYLFVLTIIREYTTLLLSEQPLDDYEMLDAAGVLSPIIVQVDEKERDELNTCTKLAVEDYKENHGDSLSRFTGWIDMLINNLDKIIGAIPEDDKNKIIQMFQDRVKEGENNG